MNLLFVGPQGSGKGTQAEIISKKIGIAHISTGDLLRASTGELKKLADSYMAQGKLVPSKIIINILKERIKQPDCKNGFILDGFPRNLEQANDVNKLIKIDKAVEITISDETSIKRLKGRWNCKKCGVAYNLVTSPKPKNDRICDNCNIPLFQRADDIDDKAIKERLEIYHQETEPLLKRYSSIKINGENSIEKVTQDVLKALK